MTIVEFLTARLGEDRELVRQLIEADVPGRWTERRGEVFGPTTMTLRRIAEIDDVNLGPDGSQLAAEHIARFDPSRILDEIDAKQAIIEFHKQWPVLVETSPQIEPDHTGGLDSIAFRMSRQIMWATEEEYRKRFGSEPPTTPMMKALASVYKDHPDFDPAWKVA